MTPNLRFVTLLFLRLYTAMNEPRCKLHKRTISRKDTDQLPCMGKIYIPSDVDEKGIYKVVDVAQLK